jgi:PAS domain S-box-containing protein
MDMREGEVVIRDIAVSPFDSDTVVVVAEGLLEKPVTSPLRFSWVYAGYLAALAIFAGIVLQQETLPGYGILVWSQSGRLGKQKKPYTDTSFIENIQQPVIIIDREYHIRALNEQAIQLFGRSREELTDQTLSAVISEQGGNIDALSEGTDSLQGSGSFPVICKKGDGELFDCLLTFSSVTNEAGGEVGYMIALTDSQWLVHIAEEYGLTPRETEIASLLIKGEKYTDMAEALHISEATLKTHIHHIYEKVGVRNRLQLIEIAREGFLRR